MAFPEVSTVLDIPAGGPILDPTIWAGKVGQVTAADFQIVSGHFVAIFASDSGYTVATYGPDAIEILTCVVPPPASSYVALFAGMTTPAGAFSANSLVLVAGAPNDTWNVRRYTGGSSGGNIITPTSPTLVAGDKIAIKTSGTTVEVWKFTTGTGSWAQVGTTVTAQTVNTGNFGVEFGDTTQQWMTLAGGTISAGVGTQNIQPDADILTTGWSTAPLFSKLNDSSDATVVTATLA